MKSLACVSTFLISISVGAFLAGQDFDFDLDILEVQAEDFFDPEAIYTARLSPNGDRIAISNTGRSRHWFHVVNTDDLETHSSFFGEEVQKEIVTYIEWKDENRIIYQTQKGNIYLAELDPMKRTLLFDATRWILFRNAILIDNFTFPRVLSTLPDDPDHILISAYNQRGTRYVYRLKLEQWDFDRQMTPFVRNAKAFDTWFADSKGAVRMAMRINRKSTELFYRKPGSDSWIAIEKLLGDETRRSFNIDPYNITEPRDYLLGIAGDTDQIYFASNREKNTMALYLYDVSVNRIVEEIAHDPDYDIVDLTDGSCIPLASPKSDRWVGFVYQRDKPTTLWLDQRFKSIQEKVDTAIPEAVNIMFDWDYEESVFLIRSIYSQKPAEYHLYQSFDDKLQALSKKKAKVATLDLQPSETIEIECDNGFTLHGYFTPASEANSDPAPMVILVHGGPWARDLYEYDPMVSCLAYNGFSVLRINFRSSTGYGYKHFFAGSQNYGTAIIEDIEYALQWAIDTGRAAFDRNAIMGFSYGGYASALIAAKRPKLFQCSIPMAGIYDLVFETKKLKNDRGKTLAFESWKRMVGSHRKDRQALADISPINFVKDIEIPIMLVHGELDEIASIEHARQLSAKLDKLKKDYKLIVMEEEGHAIIEPKNQAHVFEKIVDFLQENLEGR